MKLKNKIEKYYKQHFKIPPGDIVALPGSGSDRKYYRVFSGSGSVIAVYNNNPDENEAFISLGKAFEKKGLPVPEILAYFPAKNIYFLSDLGDLSLFCWLRDARLSADPGSEILNMYRRVLDKLVLFQVDTIGNIDLDICYPHSTFDRQSMIWDMNYFKYMFLKLLGVPFNEKSLEKDFLGLAELLLSGGQEYFMYRDFQSSNIMVVDSMPWFIDFQGGRRGAPQYDVASLLYDSKALLEDNYRSVLLEYYLDVFCDFSDFKRDDFLELYPPFVLIRIMQAMGAYGFRGIYEKKEGFAASISPAVKDLGSIFSSSSLGKDFPEIYRVSEQLLGMQAVFDRIK
jgi:aminoglycoside/choline kinase family phosphotransferase